MRAEAGTVSVNIELSETDARLSYSRAELTGVAEGTKDSMLGYFIPVGTKTDLSNSVVNGSGEYLIHNLVANLITFKSSKVDAAKWTGAVVTIYDEAGRWVTEFEYDNSVRAESDVTTLLHYPVKDGYTVNVALVVDGQSAGEYYSTNGGNGDGVDDRYQPVVTVVMQRTPFSAIMNSKTYSYVVNSGDNVQKLIEAGDYDNFPGWDDNMSTYYDSKNDVEYIRVYSEDLTKVTEDIEVEATFVEDGKDVDRFTAVSSNDKDTNGDGKVSCDEYYKTTGLVWSDEKNACVVESNGAVVVTIPNTATK